jgi:acyl carrier protein
MTDHPREVGPDGLPATWGDAERAVYERVKVFVADAADVSIEQVRPGVNIFEELNVDSLGLVLILVNLEDEFEVPQVEDDREAGKKLLTPIDIVEFAMDAAGLR